jgi:hypothetical protein
MRRPRSAWILALGLSLSFYGGAALADEGEPPPASAPDPEAVSDAAMASKQRAKELVMRATDAALADEWDAAETLFKAAWQIEKTYDIAGNLGHVELINGRYRDAAEHLRFCLRAIPPSETDAQRRRVEERYLEARKHVALLSVQVARGAKIIVDGRLAGTSPLAEDIIVEPGEHRVKIALDGFEPIEQTLLTERGGTTALVLSLKPAPRSGTARALPSSSAPSASSSALSFLPRRAGDDADADARGARGLYVPILVTAGAVIAAGVGAGVGFHIAADASEESAVELRARLDRKNGPGACLEREASLAKECDDLASATNGGAVMSIGSKVGFGLAGAALLGSVAYVIFGRSSSTIHGGTTVLPSVTSTAGGLLVTSVW